MKRVVMMLVIERNKAVSRLKTKYFGKEKKSFDKQNIMSNNRPCETAFGIFRWIAKINNYCFVTSRLYWARKSGMMNPVS